MKRFLALLLLAGVLSAAETPIHWTGWTGDTFTRAKAERRLVLLDLEAIWCHWCHVMDETTYRDPAVAGLLAKGYIAVKVDQDSRPDLSNRYEDYGWPATILFDSNGRELAKLSGYIPPERMRSLLQAFLDDPTPGPSATAPPAPIAPATSSALPMALRQQLERDHAATYDAKYGSWGRVHKFLQSDPVEYSFTNNPSMARQTLDAQLALLDPVWGGVYQYSDSGVWTNPHFEKIMPVQAANLRIYSLAYARWKEPRYLDAAQRIRGYLRDFLTSPEGAFYTSQDADLVQGEHSAEYFRLPDAARRAKGIPRVDKNVYARENGWAIESFAVFSRVAGDEPARAAAVRAAEWILANRSIEGGGFRHAGADAAGPYLGDTLAMGRAFLELYALTADRAWLSRSEAAARFVDTHFRTARPQRDENIQLVRWANRLFHYTGNQGDRDLAEWAMGYLAAPQAARLQPFAGPLLANQELGADPPHLTIVAPKDDATGQTLYREARRHPSGYLRIEWWDEGEGPLPNPDVQYPKLKRPAAFFCANGQCSPPIYDPAKLAARMATPQP